MVSGMSCSTKSDAPPTRQGVSASWVVLPEGAWPNVFEFLVARFAHIEPSVWQQRFAKGLVLNQQGFALCADAPYAAGHKVFYYRELHDEPALPVSEQVLFQDRHMVVVDKPHFMPVTPAGRYVQRSLLVRLKQRLGIDTLSPMHRIDRETAGLVLFSINPNERDAYHAMFRSHAVHKVYEAVAPVRSDVTMPVTRISRIASDERFFKSCEVAGEPNSETHVALVKQEGAFGLYRLTPVTGQRHQLRVHMNALGLPIVGDQFYPKVLRGPHDEDDHSQALQLVAKGVSFIDPITGQTCSFESQQRLNIRDD
jgi:tRNA pseudouridine32 synthase / 23S rRNA pseudouridine746 synthase